MTGEDILLGIALTVALAAGSQVLTNELYVPALIILLPVGSTAVFLLTDDDFNALASVVVKDDVRGPVYRVGPPRDGHGVVAPHTGGEILFGRPLARHLLAARYRQGARFLQQPGPAPAPPGHDVLFVGHPDGHPDGRPDPVTETRAITPSPDDTAVLLGPA